MSKILVNPVMIMSVITSVAVLIYIFIDIYVTWKRFRELVLKQGKDRILRYKKKYKAIKKQALKLCQLNDEILEQNLQKTIELVEKQSKIDQLLLEKKLLNQKTKELKAQIQAMQRHLDIIQKHLPA